MPKFDVIRRYRVINSLRLDTILILNTDTNNPIYYIYSKETNI